MKNTEQKKNLIDGGTTIDSAQNYKLEILMKLMIHSVKGEEEDCPTKPGEEEQIPNSLRFVSENKEERQKQN